MRRPKIWLSVSIALLCLAGCQDANKKPNDEQGPVVSSQDPVKVLIEGDGAFPDGLVGRWQARAHGWELVFERDGKLSSAVISLGRVRITPGETTKRPTRSGHESVFTPGRWTVHYVPASKTLTVTIVMERITVQMGTNILEGSSTDVFVGQVEAGANVWQAEWTTFPKYAAHTPENPDFKLTTDDTYGISALVTFEKVAAQ